MRATLLRRSVALTAATALISGGLTSGLLAQPAWAAPGSPATLNTVNPTQWDNRSRATLTVTGADFASGSTLVFHPCDVQPWAKFTGSSCGIVDTAGAAAHEVAAFDADLTPSPTNPTGAATASVNLALAPAGLYYLTVKHPITGESAPFKADGSPKVIFRIFDIGTATARSVAPGFDSTGVNCDPFDVVCDRGAGALDITGSNFAIGADVQFLLPDTLAVDPGLSFTPGNPGNSANTTGTDNTTGYPSSSLIQGNYAAAGDNGSPGFTPGKHLVRVVNTYQAGGIKTVTNPTVEFWQPWFRQDGVTVDTPIGQNKVGVGARDVVVTLKGRGIRNGARLSFSKPSYTVPCSDITITQQEVLPIAPADVNGNTSKIVARINVASCTTPTGNGPGRRATVSDASGASFTRAEQLIVTPAPTVDNETIATLGQGAAPDQLYEINGSGFDVSSDPAAVPCPVFDFGPGVTATTVTCNAQDRAGVRFVIDQDAAVGDRDVTVTNPSDRGSSTQGDGAGDLPPLVIEVGPKIKTISKTSFAPDPEQSETVFENVTIKGSNFEVQPTGTTSVQIISPNGEGPDPNVTPFNVRVTNANPPGGDDTLMFDLAVKAGTPAGQRTLVLTNSSNEGRFVCLCIAIDNLSVTPSTVANTGSHELTLTGTETIGGLRLGDSVGANTRVTVSRTVPLSGQPAVVGTGVVKSTADAAKVIVDLAAAAPGKYSIAFVGDRTTGTPTWTCTGCLTVEGSPITTTKLTPSTAGQGATGRLLTLDGTNFSRGLQVSIEDVTVSDVTFVNTGQITFKVDVPSDTTAEGKTVTVSAGDGSDPATPTGSMDDNQVLTVTAKPSPNAAPTNPSPNALGTGAGTASFVAANGGTPLQVTVTGDNFANDAALDLGPGVALSNVKVTQGCVPPGSLTAPCATATQDKIVADVAVPETATPGNRDVTITNGDGGRGTIPAGFTVNQGPKISSVTNELGQPALLPDGIAHDVTVHGGGFNTGADPAKVLDVLPGDKVEITNVVVVSASIITAKVKVATDAARGARTIGVTNACASCDSGFGSLQPLYVAAKPGAPGSVRLTPGAQSLRATWTPAASNGAPVTAYRLVLRDVATAGTRTADVSGSTTAHNFTGLGNGRTYELAINAVNAVATGPVVRTRGIAGVETLLSLVRSRSLVTFGGAVDLTGKLLTRSSTGVVTPLPGRTITLTFVPAKGRVVTRTATTASNGFWASRGIRLPHNWKVTARYAGDSTFRPIAKVTSVLVASRVVRSFPANGSRSAATTTLRIAGSVGPNASGKTVYLQRLVNGRWSNIRSARLSSSSTFLFALKPGKGRYAFRMYMPATFDLFKRQLNFQGVSPAFTLYRV